MPWNFLRDNNSSITESEIKSDDDSYKRVNGNRLPFARKEIVTPTLNGVMEHAYMWNEDTLHFFRKLMSDDDMSKMSKGEKEIWDKFVIFQDKSSTSPEEGQTGCTIPDTNGYSYPIVNGLVDMKDLCHRPERITLDPIVEKSLDKVFMDMILGNEHIKNEIEIPVEIPECPTDVILLHNVMTSVVHIDIDDYVQQPRTITKKDINNITFMSKSEEYKWKPIRCPDGITVRFDTCLQSPNTTEITFSTITASSGLNPQYIQDGLTTTTWQTLSGDLVKEITLERLDHKLIGFYSLRAPSVVTNMTKDWILMGWNEDFQVWDKIDRRRNQATWTSLETRLFVIERPDFYKKIRFKMYDTSVQSTIGTEVDIFNDMKLPTQVAGQVLTYECSIYRDIMSIQASLAKFGYHAIVDRPLIPILTSNTSSTIGVANQSTFSTVAEYYKAWGAMDSSSTTYWASLQITNAWMSFAFNVETAVNSYTIKCRPTETGRMSKNSRLEGSNDGVSWTLLDEQLNQNVWTSNEERIYKLSQQAVYKIYRYFIVDTWSTTETIGIGGFQLGATEGGTEVFVPYN